MYGIIYKAIEQYVVNSFGNTRWETIKSDSNIPIDTSIMEQPYNDDANYKIAVTTAKHTNKPLDEVLFDFGEHIIKTTSENYSIFMESRGNTMRDYLINLPNFHNRMMLIYPELTPPEFRVSNVEGNALVLHYISTTKGMLSFVKGYLNGLMKIFKEMPEVKVINSENEINKEYTFKISW
ncbi:heme NO-binding domain-containing protein [Flavobacterium litorale]|uniref:Heme NO-binding domain-containing protein n=1 Tax=Flavobacterium litorale TaxID=2856519 RepID=A0ABX8V3Y6_9FLAO|nr:heme NO-binding domain-containing protein [Flavobacterium litorale]QYJ67560.1 heme NO-binding domain-containing protein [Flavobacterium litorale]